MDSATLQATIKAMPTQRLIAYLQALEVAVEMVKGEVYDRLGDLRDEVAELEEVPMPGAKPTKSASWRWFKDELERLLGAEQAAALWEELRVRRVAERRAEERKRAAEQIAALESARAKLEAEGKPTARIEGMIDRRQALLEEDSSAGRDPGVLATMETLEGGG
jgi:hypothetical protein